MAAMAYVMMENGTYRYPRNIPKRTDENGNPKPNLSECMRVAGYARGSWENFEKYLGAKPEFWQLVELYRIRTTDPFFRKEAENELWSKVGHEAMRNIYERVTYYPHSLSLQDLVKIVQLMLQAGVTLQKIAGDDSKASKINQLMDKLDPAQRAKIIEGRKKKAMEEIEFLEQLEKAHGAADAEDQGIL